MTFEEWAASVPECIKRDAVWKLEAYRLALFLSDIARNDVTKLVADKRTVRISDQLYRAAGAVSADIEEGFSRSSALDRTRFLEFALGSARETRGWYYKGRHVVGPQVTDHRLEVVTQIVRLLLAMIPKQRRQKRITPRE